MDKRILKIQETLEKTEAAVIKSEANRFYLTGFNSSAGIAVITSENTYFLIDFRYFEKAKKTVGHLNTVLLKSTYKQLNEIFDSENIKKVYLECDNISLCEFLKFKENITKCEISDNNKIGALLDEMRSVKTEEEISFIKKAQEMTDKTFQYILGKIKTGVTEKEIALDMEFFMRSLGSEGVSFDFIVVSGKNSSLPHGVPTDKRIEKCDFVTMDFGAVCHGYRSDMTRTVAIGSVSERQKKVYSTVLEAQNRAFEQIKPGAVCRDIDKAARDYIESEGFKDCFGHGLGHSVGVEIHESPCFNTRDCSLIKKGNVITVEPGIYLENEFGVRIEDMAVIDGESFYNITKSPKDLIIL